MRLPQRSLLSAALEFISRCIVGSVIGELETANLSPLYARSVGGLDLGVRSHVYHARLELTVFPYSLST